MTKRETLLKKISTYQFAVLDLQMYLDTHQNDAETLE
ncbi:MAG: spore coat protein CotJB, partial [Ruminococcus sp.]|nr:spore coat protein CotJB [Ruminococcus sp.]